MRLVRFAIPVFIGRVTLRHNGAMVGKIKVHLNEVESEKDGEQTYLAVAKVDLPDFPQIDDSGRLVVSRKIGRAA